MKQTSFLSEHVCGDPGERTLHSLHPIIQIFVELIKLITLLPWHTQSTPDNCHGTADHQVS